MRFLARLLAVDEQLRICAPRLWALRLQYLALPVLGVPIGSAAMLLLRPARPWHPYSGLASGVTALVASSLLVVLWLYMTGRARRALGTRHRIGWYLGPVGTMAMLTTALAVPTYFTILLTVAANRSVIDRDTLISHARVLGYTFEQDGQILIGYPMVAPRFDSPGVLASKVRFCNTFKEHGLLFEAIALQYVDPEDRSRMSEELSTIFINCLRGRVAVRPSDAEDIVAKMDPFAASYGISRYSILPARQALCLSVALELAMIGTLLLMALQFSTWRRLGRVVLVLLALYFCLQATSRSKFGGETILYHILVNRILWVAAIGFAGLALGMAIRIFQRRSVVVDHLLMVMILAPGFAVALANSDSSGLLVLTDHGWSASAFPPFVIPEDKPLQMGFGIAFSFLLLTPIFHIVVENYRAMRHT